MWCGSGRSAKCPRRIVSSWSDVWLSNCYILDSISLCKLFIVFKKSFVDLNILIGFQELVFKFFNSLGECLLVCLAIGAADACL